MAINAILGTSFAIGSIDDALAAAQTQKLAPLKGLNNYMLAQSQKLVDNMQKLSNLKALQPEVDNLAKGLSMDGSYTLDTTDSGKTVALGDTINGTLQAQLQSVSLSLPTQERYYVGVATFDAKGNTTSNGFSSSHLASSTEMTAVANGTKSSQPGPFGGTIYYSTVTAPDGSSTVYAYNGYQTATASVADIKSLQTQIAAAETNAGGDIKEEMQNLKEAEARMLQLSMAGDAQYTALNAQQSKSGEQRQDLRRQDGYAAARIQAEESSLLQGAAQAAAGRTGNTDL